MSHDVSLNSTVGKKKWRMQPFQSHRVFDSAVIDICVMLFYVDKEATHLLLHQACPAFQWTHDVQSGHTFSICQNRYK